MTIPPTHRSLTIVIPAFNEEANLDLALDNALRAVEGLVDDLEVIVIDDGSRDKTASIANRRSSVDGRIICISNGINRGYGYSYLRGVKLATKDHVGVFTADNDMSWESFRELVKHIGQADIISSYMSNTHERELSRRVLSKSFVMIMNALFGMDMKYVNGPFISRREILQSLMVRSTGLTVLAECKVRLIDQGHSYVEVPFTHVRRQGGRSSALSFKSIKAVFYAVVLLYRDLRRG